MVQIFKYPMETFNQEINLPLGAIFHHAECQDDNPMLWFRVDLENEYENRKFCLVPTGQRFNPRGMRYLTTFTQRSLVWHLHEIS